MVGAGQLARMTSQAAISLGVGFRVLACSATDSAAQVCAGTVTGDYTALPDLVAFAAACDVVTFDHEHVPAPHLAALEQAGRQVRPGAAPLRSIAVFGGRSTVASRPFAPASCASRRTSAHFGTAAAWKRSPSGRWSTIVAAPDTGRCQTW